MTDRITKTVDGKTLTPICSICRKPLAWVKCALCRGDGVIDHQYHDESGDEVWCDIDCPECDGDGEDIDCENAECQKKAVHAVWVEIGGEA